MRNYSIVTEKDYDLFAPYGFTKTTESASLAANTYAYNTTYKAAHLNDAGADKKGSFSIPVGYAQKGDFIKVSAEVMSVSGVRPKIALDRSLTSVTGTGSGNSFITQGEKVGEFEKIEIEYLCEYDAYYSALFGLFTADVGEYYVKNCYVEVNTRFDTQPKRYKQGFRTYVILGNSGTYSVQTNFADDTATLTVDSVNKEIVLTHGKAFSGTKAGVGVMSESSSGVSPSYRVMLQSFSLTGCKIKVYDVATNTLQDPALISGQLWFTLLFSGADPTVELI